MPFLAIGTIGTNVPIWHWKIGKLKNWKIGKLEEQEKELEAVRAQLEQRLQGLEECTKSEKILLES